MLKKFQWDRYIVLYHIQGIHVYIFYLIPLQLEYKDGNSTNHKKENLELLCPNCHAQTSTYCGKNIKKISNKKKNL